MLIAFLKSKLSPGLLAFVHDARRFILYHWSAIEDTPLQLYYSALLFTPTSSVIKTRYLEETFQWISTPPIMPKYWSQAERTLEGHSLDVETLAFSPDGSKLASGSQGGILDGTVYIWNVATGEIEHVLGDYTHQIIALAFSPDGSRLVAGTLFSEAVRIWNVATGQVEHKLEGYSSQVDTLVLPPDDSKVVPTFYLVDLSKRWVTCNGLRVIHLPFNIRPEKVASSRNAIALGTELGRVVILQFKTPPGGQEVL